MRKPATPGYASAIRVTVTPGSRSGAASRIVTRRPPRASFVTLTDSTRERLASQLDARRATSAKSRDRVLHVAIRRRGGPQRLASGTAPASSGGSTCALLSSIDARADLGLDRPVAVDLAVRCGRRAERQRSAGESASRVNA